LTHDLKELFSPEDIDKGGTKENGHRAEVAYEADGFAAGNRKKDC
jgi:hypothetical protein